MQSMLLLLTASICVCHAAPDKQKKHDAEKICCKVTLRNIISIKFFTFDLCDCNVSVLRVMTLLGTNY